MRDVLDELFDPAVSEIDPKAIILDRSTLERYANCPAQGFMVEHGMVSAGSPEADAGTSVHDIIAELVHARSIDRAGASTLRAMIEPAAMQSRPDLQPQVLASLRSVYSLVGLIVMPFSATNKERAPEDLLRYDGGQGEHSGQIAGDILPTEDDGSRGPVRLTGELDLLMASPSAEELDYIDWKTGQAHWTATDVEQSFQFQFYVWLIFRNYPAVNRVRVRVYMTREGAATSPVEFTRDKLLAIHQRLVTAVGIYLKWRDTPADRVDEIPTWPAAERCSLCPAAAICPTAHAPARNLATDPEGYLRQYVALTAAAASMEKNLKNAVRANGEDLVFGDIAFGTNKPKSVRAATCDVYEPIR